MSMVKEKTYLERVSEFHKIYANEIRPILAVHEKTRKRLFVLEILAILLIPLSVLIFLFVSMGGLNLFMSYVEDSVYIWTCIICVLTFIISCIIAATIPNSFTQNLKTECLPRVLKVFPNMTWETKVHSISDSELERSALFASYNRRQSDDNFSSSI